MEKGVKLTRRKPHHYKLRKITTNNVCGDTFGITIPSEKVNDLANCFFKIERFGTSFILTSGCRGGL